MVEITLKGSYKGVKQKSKLVNPDIVESSLLRKKYAQNSLTVSKDKKRDDFYMYHSFDTLDKKYSGRWYNNSIKVQSNLKLNHKKKQMIYVIPEWQTDTSIKKKVPITINFTEKGWKKLIKFLGVDK